MKRKDEPDKICATCQRFDKMENPLVNVGYCKGTENRKAQVMLVEWVCEDWSPKEVPPS